MQLIQTKSSFIAPLGGARRVAVVSNATERRLSMKGKQSYQVDIVVGPDEPQDSAMKRFRREVMSAGLVQEVRRRRYFENSVDARKRKEKDCRIKTRRDRKFPPRTYSQTMAPEPSPFNDMFGTPDDLFADVLGDEGQQ
ncbi:hypothetical protein M9434_006655 [Picochlorum sp. BPE23]|nr:hypothetical protein M9434_006655 [Picochlorum sp. BPE23]KAI8109312.1 hypothetical protein M9435_005723 [Picochlorum sp. BPE23]WPT14465.1 30S ribosomal protein S21 [Picochlorum sp. SENEW3]|mmetsp:Transcript_1681/g.3456  ORF Transcript_1681/g.3456 Transcript_1681/m.3456 type:complete len:139 (-) Transcript_1681:77-493(-)|eukprot:jgi/Picre1/35956/NNA_003413.t1